MQRRIAIGIIACVAVALGIRGVAYWWRVGVRARDERIVVAELAEMAATAFRKCDRIHVAILDAGGDGVDTWKEIIATLDDDRRFSCRCIKGGDLGQVVLEGFDVIIVPGGSAPKQSRELGNGGKEATLRANNE